MTDVAMPPVISMPSEDEDVAFKVLNQDNLPIAIIGESILKPFGRENFKHKPNGIVYPTRRSENNNNNLVVNNNFSNLENKVIFRSNHNLNNGSAAQQDVNNMNNNLKRNLSVSHGNLSNNNNNKVDVKFTKNLDLKLRKLQKENFASNHNNNLIKTPTKKPFVTTVKKGEFLEPPPEIASLIGIKIDDSSTTSAINSNQTKNKESKKAYYAYSSEPRVLNRTSPIKNLHKLKCEAAFKASANLIGAVTNLQHNYQQKQNEDDQVDYVIAKKPLEVPLPYSNLMFDRRIHRGTNFKPCITSGHLGDGESAAARAAEARRRALARRKAKNQQVRAAQLRLGSPPPVPGRKHEPVQTELYLEEIYNDPPSATVCTQTELFLERPVSPFYVPKKTGQDQETQIYPGDLFDFDMEVQPILEVLVGKTIEQALIEVLEEEELAALREQQRRFLEIRAVETAEAQRLEEKEKRFAKEKERRMREYEKGMSLQKQMEERIAASMLMQGYLADLLPSVLEGLEADGFLTDNIKEGIDDSFMPWLMKEVTGEMKDMVSSRDILTDIVREILENRAEIYKAINQTPRSAASDEEGGPTQEDLVLADHMKLQQEIMEQQKFLEQQELAKLQEGKKEEQIDEPPPQ